jgi:4-amino-4-deoxy-L-arabinose transferase-like glycosyltransferase
MSTKLQSGIESENERARARGAAFIGASALAVSPLVAVWSRAAVTDPTLTLWITCSLLCILQSDLQVSSGKRSYSRWYILAGAFAGLAFLTKGPVGLAVPGLTWLAYHILQRDLLSTARKVPWIWSLGAFALVAMPWYVATYIVDGPSFLKWFFLRENVGRYTATMEGHGSSNPLLGFLTYPLIILLGLFPISPFLFREIASPFNGGGQDASEQMKRIRRFACVWLAAVVGIFSLSRTQLPAYIQSAAGAAAVLFAIHIYTRFKKNNFLQSGWKGGGETALLIIVGLLWTYLPIYVIPKGFAKGGRVGTDMFPQPSAAVSMWVCTAAGLLLLTGVITWKIRRNDSKMILTMLSVWAIFIGGLLHGVGPAIVHSIYQPTRNLGSYLASIPKGQKIIVYCEESPESLVFYSKRKIDFFNRTTSGVLRHVKEAFVNGSIIVTDDKGLAAFRELGIVKPMRIFGRTTVAHVSVKHGESR